MSSSEGTRSGFPNFSRGVTEKASCNAFTNGEKSGGASGFSTTVRFSDINAVFSVVCPETERPVSAGFQVSRLHGENLAGCGDGGMAGNACIGGMRQRAGDVRDASYPFSRDCPDAGF